MNASTIAKAVFIIAAVALGVAIARADTAVTAEVVFKTIKSDGSTNTWTQADLVQALGLINRKYHRDCEKASGRRAWHGRLTKEIVNTNDQTKTEVYADGQSFTYKFKTTTPAQAVANRNKKLLARTNGVPARLAAARVQRVTEIETTNVVNQVITSGN